MFCKADAAGEAILISGTHIKTLVSGEKTLMAQLLLEKGGVIIGHSHPHEQTGYLIKGYILLNIGDDTYEVQEGDSWCISPNVWHSAQVMEDSVTIEVYSPVREEFLPENNK